MTVKLPSFWPVAAGLAVVLGLKCYGGAMQDVGAEKAARQQAERTAAHYRQAVITIGSRIPKVDTVAAKATTVYLAAKVDYQHIADSIADAMNAEGKEPPTALIRACNAAIAAADTALGGCSRQVAIRDSALAVRDTLEWAQDSLIAALKKRKPFLLRLTKPVLPFLVGVGAGIVLTR